MYNKVLIIGNGFDLDLGLKTRYSDYANSLDWHFKDSSINHNLEYYLFDAHRNDKWFDIEMVIEDYSTLNSVNARKNFPYPIGKDKETFQLLIKSLSLYLRKEQRNTAYPNTLAAHVLRECVSNGYFKNIFTFNYTDLSLLAKKLGVQEEFHYKHVHGSLQNDRIIIGVREEAELMEGYDFLRKTFSHYYQSTNIPYALDEADEVIFFGHSLSPNDYHYFDTFFQKQCSESMTRKQSKHITFFTYDHNSEIEIKKQLWKMNNHRTDRLFSYNDVTFILTSNPDSSSVERLFKRLREESVEYENRILQDLANMLP